MKTYRGVEVLLHAFVTSTVDVTECLASVAKENPFPAPARNLILIVLCRLSYSHWGNRKFSARIMVGEVGMSFKMLRVAHHQHPCIRPVHLWFILLLERRKKERKKERKIEGKGGETFTVVGPGTYLCEWRHGQPTSGSLTTTYLFTLTILPAWCRRLFTCCAVDVHRSQSVCFAIKGYFFTERIIFTVLDSGRRKEENIYIEKMAQLDWPIV